MLGPGLGWEEHGGERVGVLRCMPSCRLAPTPNSNSNPPGPGPLTYVLPSFTAVRRGLLLAAFWRAVQPAVVGRAALACGMHEAALLFLELSETQRAASPAVSARAARGGGRGTPSFEHRPVLAHTDLFRRVFAGLHDADALHGLQSDTSTDMLVRRRWTSRLVPHPSADRLCACSALHD